ncbi:hypothetical protein SLE2022_087810 [Rubroshorea leprosula]
MSSDLYVFGGSFYPHKPSGMVFSDSVDLLFSSDPSFSPVDDTTLQEISSVNHQNPVEESNSLDQFSSNFLPSSPPSSQLESLSIYQIPQMQSMSNGYSGVDNVGKLMQRSFSSNSFEGKPGFSFQPCFDSLMESPNFQSSPDSSFFSGQMRRVCSTGDLQCTKKPHNTQTSFSSSLATDSSIMAESNFKVGRYSAEERKERILKYRAKRNQRNFNKTIKYACRKTLADNRPRIRGRFARNDEAAGDVPKAACSTRDEDEEEQWFDGLNEEEDGSIGRRGSLTNFGQPQFHYYSCF